jgi:hypothetical protein
VRGGEAVVWVVRRKRRVRRVVVVVGSGVFIARVVCLLFSWVCLWVVFV